MDFDFRPVIWAAFIAGGVVGSVVFAVAWWVMR